MSETYCPLPWMHLYAGPAGDVAPCCVGKPLGSNNDNTLEEIWNNDEMKQLRLDLTSGVKNSHCSECYRIEDAGGLSSRIKYSEDMNHVIRDIVPLTQPDGTLEKFELQYVDLRFNNLCNFKCRSCNEVFSSQIASERIKNRGNPEYDIPWRPIKVNTTFVKNEKAFVEIKQHYQYIRKIYFAGGEPMIQQEHWEILDDLVTLGLSENIELIYSTNGSTLNFKGKNVLDYWAKFNKVYVQFSIDAMDKQAEYWRDGTVWEEIDNNLKLANTCPNVEVSIHSTIAWPTVSSWISFVKHAITNKLINDNNLTVWCLTTPKEFCLHTAPPFKKDQIRKELKDLIVFLKENNTGESILSKVESIISFMDSKHTFKHLIDLRYVCRTDKSRKKNFLDYFPEHQDMKDYFLP